MRIRARSFFLNAAFAQKDYFPQVPLKYPQQQFYMVIIQRVCSSLVLWGVAITAIVFFQAEAGVWLLAALGGLLQYEIYQLLGLTNWHAHRGVGLIFGLSLIPGVYYGGAIGLSPIIFLVGALILCACVAVLKKKKEEALREAMATLFGLLYAPFMLLFLVLLMQLEAVSKESEGLLLAFWLVLTVKMGDSAAWFFGSIWGKHKIAPWLSPGKTVEGAIGGVLGSVITGGLFAFLLSDDLPSSFTIWHGAFLAIPLSALGILSDLFASLLKRKAKVKNSGRLIPGIGGILDLTDSLILTSPLGYLMLHMI